MRLHQRKCKPQPECDIPNLQVNHVGNSTFPADVNHLPNAAVPVHM